MLSGIGPGISEEYQQVTVTAIPYETALITSLSLNHTPASSNAVLVFTTAPSSFGESPVTVTVDDGFSKFNRTFRVTVAPQSLPSQGARWIIPQNSSTLSLDLASAFTGGTGQMLSDYSVGLGRPSQPGLLSSIYFDQAIPSGRTRLNATPGFDAFGRVTAYLSFTDLSVSPLPFTPSVVIEVVSTNKPPRMDPPEPFELWADSGPITVQLNGIQSFGRPDQAIISVVASNTNPAVLSSVKVDYTSPQNVAIITIVPKRVPGSAVIPITVSDLQPANNSTNYTLMVSVRKVNQPPTIDPLADMLVFSDSQVIIIPLSGISDGDADEIQGLTVTAWSDSPDLLRDPQVVYTSPSSVGQLLLSPFSDAIGPANVTVEVQDGQPRNFATSRTFRLQLEQWVNRMAAVAGNTIVSRGNQGAIDFFVHSTTHLTNFGATLRIPAKELSDLWVSVGSPEVDPASLVLSPMGEGVWRLSLATRPGQSLTYVRKAAVLHFTTAPEGPSSFVPVRISEPGGWAEGNIPITNWTVSQGELAVLADEPLLKACSTLAGLRLCLYGLPFANYRIEYRDNLDQPWFVLRENLQVLEPPLELEVDRLQPATFFRAVEIR
jgi:hypothetical protein